MPDPHTTPNDVEDVLSSIRKLVSDRPQPTAGDKEDSVEPAPTEAEVIDPGALVLTSSQLVKIPEQAAANIAKPLGDGMTRAGKSGEQPERVVSRLHLFEIAEQEEIAQADEYYEDEVPLPLGAELSMQSEPEDAEQDAEEAEDAFSDERWPEGDESAEFERPDVEMSVAEDLVQEGAPSDVNWVDGDVLREMIAKAVQEELEGETGTRLSRNLRKMVRREIRRALQTREFD